MEKKNTLENGKSTKKLNDFIKLAIGMVALIALLIAIKYALRAVGLE